MKTTIDEIMNKKIETIEESASVQQVAIKMKDKNTSSVIVVDSSGKPKGLVTERECNKRKKNLSKNLSIRLFYNTFMKILFL